ncbi:glycosyltransferase family 32 protein [Faecalibacterium prausnitzii]|uniref:Glycosyl transferase n=1 Tax=Faecalibacterium prausnitzii TaxID=853 RepID=A0A329TNI7_9FIRM|nr:glycosyltransferase [Faecalibacterium prausnitzii]RAW51261.1 glycosyl transferase [Faecalibacterium prausnitzii]
MNKQIPKIIHYCWFGKNPLNEEALHCLASWKKYFPEYRIIQWDESNFDFDSCDYAKEAYQAKKWAFVSDYARFKILYQYGGIYVDTDVEVIKSFDDLLERGPFFGKEQSANSFKMVNPGLGMAAYDHMTFCEKVVEYYEKIHFDPNEHITVCDHITKMFLEHGYKGNNEIETIDGFTLYPVDYFCPKDYLTGVLKLTENSHSIHLYSATWQNEKERKFMSFEQRCYNKFGLNSHNFFPIKYAMYLYCYGVTGCMKKVAHKLEKIK